mmetsp:Transcript_6031/g.12613  ORF Transcript_6031/g.12613 Transcript_6031/m.12613 type:complete len:534 (-) Transcript_6031:539-2140(-)
MTTNDIMTTTMTMTTTTTTTTRAYPAITIAKKPPTMTTSTPSTATAGRVSLSPMAAPSSHAAAAAAAMVPGGSKKKKEGSGVTTEVPIFLQKTYHMIDTCDPRICTWSEDGLTFIVKDTTLFETTIIPQFFKHNKFSSFVRQLNFYGFRKIKYCDSLRIDPQMEAETANFWRFKHDKFRRGRKDLLIEIKRSGSNNTQSSAAASAQAAAAVNAKVAPAVVASSVANAPASPKIVQIRSVEKPEEVTHLKTEVEELKEQIASMTKNIDELTSMVKNISVKDEEPVMAEAGTKRKKLDPAIKEEPSTYPVDLPMPDWNPSSADVLGPVDDSTALAPFTSLLDAPLPELVTSRENSITSNISDDGFVDNLFQVFADDDGSLELDSMEGIAMEEPPTTTPACIENAPDPKLMKRIEDSLATIPKDMHEMLANRLIEAISDTQPIAKAATLTVEDSSVDAENTPLSSAVVDFECDVESTPIAESTEIQAAPTISLPLAVATLRTILAEYGVSVECHRTDTSHIHRRMAKVLPVVPVHA